MNETKLDETKLLVNYDLTSKMVFGKTNMKNFN
jgi:hypothetical protein